MNEQMAKTNRFPLFLLLLIIVGLGTAWVLQLRGKQAALDKLATTQAQNAILQDKLEAAQAELDILRKALANASQRAADHEQLIHDLRAETERLQAATQHKKEGGRGDKHLWAIWEELQKAVATEALTQEAADARMGEIKTRNGAVMRELRAAVAAGELTGTEAREKLAAYKAELAAEFAEKDVD